MRSSLLSAVSHDLRTPLAGILGAATALRDPGGPASPAARADLLDAICEEAARLERLLTNLLDMTRLESGVQLKREWVPVEELVGSALTRLEEQLAGRRVDVDLAPGLPLASVDPVLLEQVLLNLLDNAAKHTPPGTSLAIAAQAEGQGVRVGVLDRGPGLRPGEEERVFDKFYRGGAGAPGAGLGLAICKAIVEAHGGSISALPRSGGGAEVRFTLPAPSAPPSALP
jgi:two-component system, OmpR family, sensor histidine kinase KdpD